VEVLLELVELAKGVLVGTPVVGRLPLLTDALVELGQFTYPLWYGRETGRGDGRLEVQ
jgi:hypothetical protein